MPTGNTTGYVRSLLILLACCATGGFSPAIALAQNESDSTDVMGQVTAVSQLSDVEPTDWAFQALRSLVERYGCLEGYPDQTFRGNRAITRYEFAAGLNACLDRLSELIANSTRDRVRQDDLQIVQQLQEKFAAELAALRDRVATLEVRTATLEHQQFSPTTQFQGQVLVFLADAFGANASPANNTTLGYRVRLNFLTSFTGQDLLKTQLQARNLTFPNTATEFPQSFRSNGVPVFGPTNETRLVGSSPTPGNGTFGINFLGYQFPIGNQLRVYLDAGDSDYIYSPLVNSLGDSSKGSVSYFGQTNPLAFPIRNQAGIGLQWIPAPWLNVDLGYRSGPESNEPFPRRGFFNGSYSTLLRTAFFLGPVRLAALYINSYSPDRGIDPLSGSNTAKVIGAGPVVGNIYNAAAFLRVSPKFEFGVSAAYAAARTLGSNTRGDADVWSYYGSLSFRDLWRTGNEAGILVGVQPRLSGTSNSVMATAIGLPPGQRSDRDVGWTIEAFYSYRVNDFMTITPGVFWLTAPNHDARNPDVVVGAIRTTFSF